MNEKCGVCERPKGDSHYYPVAGECTAPDASDYTVSLQCLSIALRKAQDDVKAAEERGRRCGVEECKAALIEAREALEQIWAAIGDRLCGKGPLAKEYAQAVAAKAAAAAKRIYALAPRDSGKEG